MSDYLDEFCRAMRGSRHHTLESAARLQLLICNGDLHEEVEQILERDFDKYSDRPVIPMEELRTWNYMEEEEDKYLNFGFAWDIKLGRRISHDEMLPLYHTAKGWSLPSDTEIGAELAELDLDDPGIRAITDAFSDTGRYRGWLPRLAALLCGTSKDIDVIRAFTSSYGKGTLIELCQAAFPNCIGRLSAGKCFSAQGRKFATLASPLTQYLVVYIDEIDKVEKIPNTALTELTDTELTVELKGKDARQMRRSAAIVMVGNDYPKIDPEAIGIKTRFNFALNWDDTGYGEMTAVERKLLLSDSAVGYFRSMVLEKAKEWMAGTDTPAYASAKRSTENCANAMLDALTNPLIQVLRDEYAEVREVLSADLTQFLEEVCKDYDIDPPKTSAIKQLMRAAFPNATNSSKRIDGKKKRIWRW